MCTISKRIRRKWRLSLRFGLSEIRTTALGQALGYALKNRWAQDDPQEKWLRSAADKQRILELLDLEDTPPKSTSRLRD